MMKWMTLRLRHLYCALRYGGHVFGAMRRHWVDDLCVLRVWDCVHCGTIKTQDRSWGGVIEDYCLMLPEAGAP